MKPVLDIKKTLGQLNFLGVDETYKLASQEQGEQITVKTPNKVELDYLQECELVEPDVKMYVQMSGDFGTIAYSWNAEDIKVVGSNSALKQK